MGSATGRTMKGRLSLRIKPETKLLLEKHAKARGISAADLLSQIAERHLRRNGGVSRSTDNTKPRIGRTQRLPGGSERTRNRPDNTEVVKINPLLTVTAKESIQLEAKATGIGTGPSGRRNGFRTTQIGWWQVGLEDHSQEPE